MPPVEFKPYDLDRTAAGTGVTLLYDSENITKDNKKQILSCVYKYNYSRTQ
jgi:hypothetical protein